MMVVLNIHYWRASDIVVPDHVTTIPSVPLSPYRDGFGNWCTRLVAPKGQIRIASTAIVKDSGEPDIVAPSAQQHSIQHLPEESLVFLLGSRYCDTEKFSEVAWACLVKHRWVGAESRRSVISCTTISHSAMSMPAPQRPHGKRSMSGEASAAITRIWLSHSADV